MKVLITEKLSEHRYKTPEGYLVCVDAILARTGPQIYKHNQVYDGSTDEITDVEVDRKPEQVFSPQAIASFENKPLTIQHPNEPVTIANHKELYHGFARDIRRAVKRNGQLLTGSKRPSELQADDQEVLVGNIIVTTSDAIEEIDNGLEFLSCGYDCDITQTDKPEQINIRGNHIALCDNPRAGITMLQDSTEPFVQHFIKVLTDALDTKIEINKIEGGKADKLSIEEIAKKHNVSINEIVEQLIKGIDVEFEHTNDKNKAKEIAMDHLVEMPDYYTKLAKMESQDALNTTRTLFNGKQIICKSIYVKNLKKGQQMFEYVSNAGILLTIKDIQKREVNGTMYYTIQTNTTHNGKQIELVRIPFSEVLVFVKQVNDAINYVVMCEVLYNGVAVKSRAPWIVFRSEDKSKAEQFVKENNAKTKSLVGFSQHYYIK